MAIQNLTRFPGGVAQHTAFAAGGAAGDITVVSPLGLAADDLLLSVIEIEFDGTGDIVSVTDMTDEFSITAANTINNTGGTATTDNLLAVCFAKTAP